MVKFENRVALMKTNHFIKTTPLILFVELLSTAKQNKKSFSVENIKQHKKGNFSNIKSIILKEIRSFSDGEESCHKDKKSKKNFIFKQLKNNYLKKSLIEYTNLSHSPKTSFFRSNVISFNHAISLAQGNKLVLFLDNNSLFFLKNLEQNKNISILGGIYKKHVLSHDQIARLIKLSKNNQIYHNLNFLLKEKAFFGQTLLNQTPLRFFSFFSRNIYAKLCFTIAFRIKNFNN